MNHTTKKINTAKLLKTILSLVMVLSLLVGCSMMFVGCSGSGNNNETQPGSNKHDPAQYEGLNDKDYFQTLTYNYLSDVTAALSKGYDAYMSGFKGGSAGAKVGMTLTLGDPVLDLLEDAAGGAMDFGFLSKVSLDMDVGSKDQLTQTKMALGLNGKDIATVTMLMDMANYAMYMGVPELNSTYIKMDLMEAMGGMNGSAASMQGMMAAAAQFVDELPSGAELETLINRYVKAALGELDNVKREKTTLEAGGLEQECAKMTVKIYEKDALDMAKAVLTTAKNDKDLKKIIEDVVSAAADMAGESIDASSIYNDFTEMIDSALDQLEYEYEELDDEYIELVMYIDANHSVIGADLSISDGSIGDVHFYTVTEGKNFASELIVENAGLEVTGEGTIGNGKITGTYNVEVQGEDTLTLEVKDLDAEGGTITLKPAESIMNNITGGADLPFEDIALEIKLDKDGIELNALSGSKKLVGIALTVKESSIGSVKLPTKYVDGTDTDELMNWVSGANFNTLLNNLKKAGVPSDLVDSLESMLGG